MTVHLVKLCVGVSEVAELAEWQQRRLRQASRVYHVTRMAPKRAADLLDGGSMYWVMRSVIMVRQRVVAVERFTDAEGIDRCRLVFDPELMPVRPVPRRAFQGWRYLDPTDAPDDLVQVSGHDEMPPQMRADLAALGLI